MKIDNQRKIGLIGGLSYASTLTYYKRLNELVNQHYGQSHSAKIILESLDFQPIAAGLAEGNDRFVIAQLKHAAQTLERAGADHIAMCCNTVHKFAPHIKNSLNIDLVNICDCTAHWCADRDMQRVGLLGSAFTTGERFYKDAFTAVGIDVEVPALADRQFMQQAIETELSVGVIKPISRQRFLNIAQELVKRGCDALILACTEIPMIVHQEDITIPVIDTVEVHCQAIVERAIHIEQIEALT